MGEIWNQERLEAEWTARGFNRRDLLKMIAGGASGAALLTMMGAHVESVSAQDGETQVNVKWDKPVTLNPLFSTSGSEQQIERLMFGTVLKMSDALVPTPDLAESFEGNADATEFTIKLKPGLAFTDGTPLTSADVIFTISRALDSRTGSFWRGRLSGIEGSDVDQSTGAAISGLTAPDESTVVIKLSKPNASFPIQWVNFAGQGILPQHVLGEIAPDQLQASEFSLAPTVTAGPYKFVQYATDQYLEVEKNEAFAPGVANVDRIFLRILTAEAAIAELETGGIDLMSLPVSEMERVQKLENVTVTTVQSPSMDFLAFNFEREHLQNKALRQAFMYAIDRESIVAQVLEGEGTVVNSPIFGPEWMGVPEGLNLYPFDPEKAKSLIAESGFDTGTAISIMTVPGVPEQETALAIMQEQLSQVGLNIEILQVDTTELNRRYIQEADFDIFYNAGGVFRADPNISATYFLTTNFTPNGGNGSHYSNPQVDELYSQGTSEADEAKRKEIYTEVAKILNDEVPWVFLWNPNSIFAVSKRLTGFAPPSYSNNKFWNAETWSVTE
jgi:peptide/nickel transport system substrate-binding protein